MSLCIFFHALLAMGNPPELLPHAVAIVHNQMETLKTVGLEDAASEIHVGVNGGEVCRGFAESLFPEKARIVYHPDSCCNENRTILMIEERIKTLLDDDFVLYFHGKGCSRDPDSEGGKTDERWRRCMMYACVERWRECVESLESGMDACGVHWVSWPFWQNAQRYFAGNFWWSTGKFLKTLPSIMIRDRIRQSGIDSPESRYEAEIILGNGPRPPRVRDMDMSHRFAKCP